MTAFKGVFRRGGIGMIGAGRRRFRAPTRSGTTTIFDGTLVLQDAANNNGSALSMISPHSTTRSAELMRDIMEAATTKIGAANDDAERRQHLHWPDLHQRWRAGGRWNRHR
jgi:hypothetical protein